MKRIFASLLALVLVFGLVGCSGSVGQETAGTESVSLTYRDVASFLKSQLEAQFTYTDISYDETGMTVFLSIDGISTTCYLAQSGSSSMAEPWNDILSSTEELAKSMTDAFRSIGCDDFVVSVIIVNDLNTDDMLAMFLNGGLIFDAAGSNA